MTEQPSQAWSRYGAAVIAAMDDALAEAEDGHHPMILETADYWLSLGLTIGLHHPEQAKELLHLIEANEQNRTDLAAEAGEFLREALP